MNTVPSGTAISRVMASTSVLSHGFGGIGVSPGALHHRETYNHAVRLLPVLLVALLGCGKKAGPDCDRYAAKYAATMNPSSDAQAKMIFDDAHHQCDKGRVDVKKATAS